MAVKATFLPGKNTTTTDSLFQWDYGQVLEIESTDLGTQIVEVHFACPNMSEAIVRSCSLTNGIGTVTIPDDCLEQTSTITAWVYEIVGTQGSTRKVITIPVTARKRPSVAKEDIPVEISNRYTELITEVNEAVNRIENGDVMINNAKNAEKAGHATTAGSAATTNYAIKAGMAEKDVDGNLLTNNLRCSVGGYTEYFFGEGPAPREEIEGGLIMFRIESDTSKNTIIAEVGDGICDECMYSGVFYDYVPYGKDIGWKHLRLVFDPTLVTNGSGWYRIHIEACNNDSAGFYEVIQSVYPVSVSYKYLSKKYEAD